MAIADPIDQSFTKQSTLRLASCSCDFPCNMTRSDVFYSMSNDKRKIRWQDMPGKKKKQTEKTEKIKRRIKLIEWPLPLTSLWL